MNGVGFLNGVHFISPGFFNATFTAANGCTQVNLSNLPLLNFVDIGGYSTNRRVDLNCYPPALVCGYQYAGTTPNQYIEADYSTMGGCRLLIQTLCWAGGVNF